MMKTNRKTEKKEKRYSIYFILIRMLEIFLESFGEILKIFVGK